MGLCGKRPWNSSKPELFIAHLVRVRKPMTLKAWVAGKEYRLVISAVQHGIGVLVTAWFRQLPENTSVFEY